MSFLALKCILIFSGIGLTAGLLTYGGGIIMQGKADINNPDSSAQSYVFSDENSERSNSKAGKPIICSQDEDGAEGLETLSDVPINYELKKQLCAGVDSVTGLEEDSEDELEEIEEELEESALS